MTGSLNPWHLHLAGAGDLNRLHFVALIVFSKQNQNSLTKTASVLFLKGTLIKVQHTCIKDTNPKCTAQWIFSSEHLCNQHSRCPLQPLLPLSWLLRPEIPLLGWLLYTWNCIQLLPCLSCYFCTISFGWSIHPYLFILSFIQYSVIWIYCKLSFPLLMDICADSRTWLYWIKLLWTF